MRSDSSICETPHMAGSKRVHQPTMKHIESEQQAHKNSKQRWIDDDILLLKQMTSNPRLCFDYSRLTFIIIIFLVQEPAPPDSPLESIFVDSDDERISSFTGNHLFDDRNDTHSNKQTRGRYRERGTFEDGNSNSGDDEATQCGQRVRTYETLARSSRPSRPSRSSSSLNRCTSSSKPNTIEQNDTSDDGEVDGNHRFKDVSITGNVRIVYEKAKAELSYKVLYETPFPGFEETRTLLADVWKVALAKCKIRDAKADRKIKTAVSSLIFP